MERRKYLPHLVRFVCLTCNSRMLRCDYCNRYLCLCTTKQWHGQYDTCGVVCDKCKNKQWPTKSGFPWDDDYKSIGE